MRQQYAPGCCCPLWRVLSDVRALSAVRVLLAMRVLSAVRVFPAVRVVPAVRVLSAVRVLPVCCVPTAALLTDVESVGRTVWETCQLPTH